MEHQIDGDTLLRFAREDDAPLIFEFISELAEYEKMTDQVTATPEDIRKTIFRDKRAEVIICEYRHRPVGFALFFHNYSTFLGKPGLYLEDLYIRPEARRRGLGKTLLAFLAKIARERDCGRLEWACLDWNRPSIDFYLSLGAVPMDQWTVYRLTPDKFSLLADRIPPEEGAVSGL